jgi:hypothetical protein
MVATIVAKTLTNNNFILTTASFRFRTEFICGDAAARSKYTGWFSENKSTQFSPNLDVDYREDFEREKLCCYFFGSLSWRSRLRVVFNHMKKKNV